MKLIYNSIIPFKGFKAMCIWPLVFVRKDANIIVTDIQHEQIHGYQQREMHATSAVLMLTMACVGLIPLLWVLISPLVYFALYVAEYAIRLFAYRFNRKEAYRNISCEQEAYLNQNNAFYTTQRKPFTHLRYLFRKTYVKNK